MYSESGSVFIEPLMSNSHLHRLQFTYKRRLLIIFENSLDPQNIEDLFILRLNTCHNMYLTSLIHCVIMRRKNQVEGLEKKYTLSSFSNTEEIM